MLESALLLWRGEPLADIPSPVLCDREIPRLTGMRLRAVETELDQCWDLLRQRRARREFGEDPSGAVARSTNEVEGYLQ